MPLPALVSRFNKRCFLRSRCSMEMWCPDDTGLAGIGLGHLLGREHDSTPQSGVEAPRLLKRSLSRLYCCCFVVLLFCCVLLCCCVVVLLCCCVVVLLCVVVCYCCCCCCCCCCCVLMCVDVCCVLWLCVRSVVVPCPNVACCAGWLSTRGVEGWRVVRSMYTQQIPGMAPGIIMGIMGRAGGAAHPVPTGRTTSD